MKTGQIRNTELKGGQSGTVQQDIHARGVLSTQMQLDSFSAKQAILRRRYTSTTLQVIDTYSCIADYNYNSSIHCVCLLPSVLNVPVPVFWLAHNLSQHMYNGILRGRRAHSRSVLYSIIIYNQYVFIYLRIYIYIIMHTVCVYIYTPEQRIKLNWRKIKVIWSRLGTIKTVLKTFTR